MRFIWIVILLFIASVTWAQSKNASKEPRKVNTPCADPCRNQSSPAHPPTNVNDSPSQTSSSESTKKDSNKHDEPWEKHVAVWTAILALATFALAGVALWQRFDLKDSSQRQLRAYVSIQPKTPVRFPTFDKWHSDGLIFVITNNGATPAYCLRHTLNTALRSDDSDLEPVLVSKTGSRLVLNPGMQSEVRAFISAPLKEEHKETLLRHEKAIYVWGEIQYSDAFKKAHYTRFRLAYVGDGSKGPPSGIHWRKDGNESD